MSDSTGLDLADAIEELRNQLELARIRAVNADIQFPITSATVELQFVAVKEGKGKAGFKVPVINLELGASGSTSHEVTHRISIEFGSPVTSDGKPVRVDRVSSLPME
jgi:hypothetical protein